MGNNLKLFVWNNHGTLAHHTSGIICVLSESHKKALKQIELEDEYCMNDFDHNDYEVHEEPIAFVHWGADAFINE